MSKIVTLSEASSIALHGMVLLAKSDRLLNVLQIAEVTGSSKHHVAKVFQRLVKENFIESRRGPSGGFAMKKKPDEISLLNIYEAIEGKLEVHDCVLDKSVCPFGKCMLDNVTREMTLQYRNYLENQTLDKFL